MPATASPPRKTRFSLTTWIMIGLVAGIVMGAAAPEWADRLYFFRDIFLNLIKSIIAPLVFSTIVAGIAGGGDAKAVGRMGIKALVYFEVVTTAALFVGLGVVNWIKPGIGVHVDLHADFTAVDKVAQNHPKSLTETLVHVFPSSVVDAMAHGDVLQIVAFSVVFAFALSAIGKRGKPVLVFCEALGQVMFKFTGYVMLLAPLGVGAAMAHTVAHQGLGVLKNLGMLIGSLYLALALFAVFVLGTVAVLARVPIRKFVRAVREPCTIAFVTTSSESALPKAMEQMERLGVPRRIVGFVMPTGYSFNLDGTTLYLALGSVFVAQAAETTIPGFHMGIEAQITMLLTLMVTSKGVAAVPRASLVILLATLNTFLPNGIGPAGIALIFGVDELMDMARTATNVLGNCLATVVVARWEGQFDDARASAYGTALEQPLASDELVHEAA